MTALRVVSRISAVFLRSGEYGSATDRGSDGGWVGKRVLLCSTARGSYCGRNSALNIQYGLRDCLLPGAPRYPKNIQ